MADNWSASTITLANIGDWCEWSFSVPDSTTRDQLNGVLSGGTTGTALRSVTLRGALGGASRQAALACNINDELAFQPDSGSGPAYTVASSSSGWISANRFAGLLGFGGVFTNASFPVPPGTNALNFYGGVSVPYPSPFVVGTNTIRLINLGNVSGTPDGTAQAIEVDFLAIQAGGTVSAGGPYAFLTGTDSASESAPASFATHTNPNSIGSETHAWLLKAPDATTGTVDTTDITVRKFCPAGTNMNIRFRVTGSGSPLAGTAGAFAFGDEGQFVTLDGNGEAVFVVDNTPGYTSFIVLYGGSDLWSPQSVLIDGDDRFGCNGWHLGRIGVG